MQRNCDCGSCGRLYEAKRPSSKYCSDTCRKRGQRGDVAAVAAALTVVPVAGGLKTTHQATLDELTAVGRENSMLGAAALRLAQQVDEARAVMGFAALVKELRATMLEAVRDVDAAGGDALDEIQQVALRLLHGT